PAASGPASSIREPQAEPQAAPRPAGTMQSTRRLAVPKRRGHQSTTTAVHKAWLKEIIDLDRDGAVTAYNEILRDSPREQPERWIAVARLRELDRLGVRQAEPIASPGQE